MPLPTAQYQWSLQLEAVDEDCLQFVDVFSGLDGDAGSAWRAGESAARVTARLMAAQAHVFIIGFPTPSQSTRALRTLVAVVREQRGQAVVVQYLMRGAVEVSMVLWSRTVAGADGGAVGHQAGLEAAVPAPGPVQVQAGDQRFTNVDALGPVNRVFLQGDEGALKTHVENEILLELL